MGFRPEPRHLKLNFAETDLAGLEVTMSSVTVAEFNEMMRLALAEGVTPETLAANDRLLEMFAAHLVHWNLEDERGKPVARTVKAVLAQERHLIGQVITAWQVALVTVPKPQQTESANGASALSKEDVMALMAASETPAESQPN